MIHADVRRFDTERLIALAKVLRSAERPLTDSREKNLPSHPCDPLRFRGVFKRVGGRLFHKGSARQGPTGVFERRRHARFRGYENGRTRKLPRGNERRPNRDRGRRQSAKFGNGEREQIPYEHERRNFFPIYRKPHPPNGTSAGNPPRPFASRSTATKAYHGHRFYRRFLRIGKNLFKQRFPFPFLLDGRKGSRRRFGRRAFEPYENNEPVPRSGVGRRTDERNGLRIRSGRFCHKPQRRIRTESHRVVQHLLRRNLLRKGKGGRKPNRKPLRSHAERNEGLERGLVDASGQP